MTVTDVAVAVGYGSASHFTKDFKATFGKPPAGYASAHAKNRRI